MRFELERVFAHDIEIEDKKREFYGLADVPENASEAEHYLTGVNRAAVFCEK